MDSSSDRDDAQSWRRLHFAEISAVPGALVSLGLAGVVMIWRPLAGVAVGFALMIATAVSTQRSACPKCGGNFLARVSRRSMAPPEACGVCGFPRLGDPAKASADAHRIARIRRIELLVGVIAMFAIAAYDLSR